ncbi:MAG: hypothetical protein VKJ06_07195 [Vampirovibrionales bacterium]|nr:hypothetical protein [Vampirovibrionales bacterium]
MSAFFNNCSKCGKEFETKNPKRVICPDCLYPERIAGSTSDDASGYGDATSFGGPPPRQQGGYGAPHGGYGAPPPRQPGGYGAPQGGYGTPLRHQGGYGAPPPRQPGGYGPPRQQGGYGAPPPRQPGGYGPPRQPGGYGPPRQGFGPPRQPGGYGPPRQPGGYGPPRQGFGPPRQGFGGRPGGMRPGGPPRGRGPARQPLIPREALAEIERIYKLALPLPNPDIHETIGQTLNIEDRKIFFGINLVRQKMRLPKLDYPKRKLAVTPDQIMAVQSLYEPYLPLPPIGIHKIIAKQLRMDEWRVHVAIGLIRKTRNMDRWNEDRDDLPPAMKAELEAAKLKEAQKKEASPLEAADPAHPNTEAKTERAEQRQLDMPSAEDATASGSAEAAEASESDEDQPAATEDAKPAKKTTRKTAPKASKSAAPVTDADTPEATTDPEAADDAAEKPARRKRKTAS